MDPLAIVMGDIDVVRPLVLAGIPCAALAPHDDPVRWSRHLRARLPWNNHWTHQAEAIDVLLAFARSQPNPPVLMPQTDGDLLLVSSHREQLNGPMRFLLADAALIEALVDKASFAELAQRLELPAPHARRLRPFEQSVADVDLRFPLVIKPLTRRWDLWFPIEPAAKACHVASPVQLAALWPRLADSGMEVLAQEAVEGPEHRIESYHAYVDKAGRVVADFTGRKIRTRPSRYGHSTAVEITAAQDVAAVGREVLERIALQGVAKVDFKRAPDGSLHLLEVNPRFSLWHHPAAVAGVNLPALVYDDLTGRPRLPVGRAQPGVRWCLPISDALAARAEGVSLARWLRFVAGCEARSGLAWDDPFPFVPGALLGPLLLRLSMRGGTPGS